MEELHEVSGVVPDPYCDMTSAACVHCAKFEA